MQNLEQLIKELENNIPHQAFVNKNVSQGSVGWHIEHSLITLNLIIDVLCRSEPSKYKWAFNYKRTFVSVIGKIPRGRVKAPEVVQPKTYYDTQTLQQHVILTKERIKSLPGLENNNYFTHPFLGDFNKRPAIRFLQIHTKHHLKIINDIIEKK
jgi:hypothetical protein